MNLRICQENGSKFDKSAYLCKNNTIMKFKTIIILSLIFVCASYTYYEHGPTFSLKSAKTRIKGELKLTDVMINDKTENILLENEKTELEIRMLVENSDLDNSVFKYELLRLTKSELRISDKLCVNRESEYNIDCRFTKIIKGYEYL